MPARVNVDCYVYAVMDGEAVIYVGKGTGSRFKDSARKFGGVGKVLERFTDEDAAFARERELICEWQPSQNKATGGNGGRIKPSKLTAAEKRAHAEWRRYEREFNAVGPRRYVARFLLEKDLGFILPAPEVAQIRQMAETVANGPWC
jgi:hypothetical protein